MSDSSITASSGFKPAALLALRVTLGWLMVIWGLDKITNVEHAVRVSDAFYGGLVSGPAVWQLAGYAQTALGVLIVVGLFRRFTYPALLVITGVTFLAVWKSIVDPLGFGLGGGNVLFYPSSTIFFAGLTVLAFRADDLWSVDARRARGTSA